MELIDCSAGNALERASKAIRADELVVLPTDTVYGLAANPLSRVAVDRLLSAKGRGRDKPSPVLVACLQQAENLVASLPEAARQLMQSHWPGGLTLVLESREMGWDLGETGGTVAVRMPAHPYTLKLLEETGPLAVSSANLTAAPPALTACEAMEQLGEKVAVYLDGGACSGGVASTIVSFTPQGIRILREGAVSREEIARVGEIL